MSSEHTTDANDNDNDCNSEYVPQLTSLSNTRNTITLSWNPPVKFERDPVYKVQLKDRLWGWITKYWGFRTQVEIKDLGPQECFFFRVGVIRSNNKSDVIWSSTLRAVTKDEHIAAISLHRAILYRSMNLTKKYLALRPSAIDCYDSNGKTALMRCSRIGDVSLISLLISAGASVNLQSINSQKTALMIACWFGHLETAVLLHENKADWSIKDNHGCTALHYAVDNSQVDLIKFAIECKADVEARDNNGWTPILRGVYLGSNTVSLNELIKNGASVNVCDSRGQTPLMQAVISSNEKMPVIKLLVSAGADVNALNIYNNTSVMMANAYSDKTILEELIMSLKNDIDDKEHDDDDDVVVKNDCDVSKKETEEPFIT